ncbi:MAG: N-acetylmuramoyl-L-alanine amidase [Bacteroidota bacterium]
MKKFFILSLFIFLQSFQFSYSQKNYQEQLISKNAENALQSNYLDVKIYFDDAYSSYPDVPKGVLEAVSYHYTHFRHITASAPESSEGIPRVYGITGLTLDGKNYFRNNLLTVAALSGFAPEEIIEDPAINVRAFAAAFTAIKKQQNIESAKPEDMINIFIALSELNITGETAVNDYAMNLYLFGIMKFLNNTEYQEKYNFPDYSIDLVSVFGENNLKIFQSSKVNISNGSVTDDNGLIYAPADITVACPDYNFSNCSWVASPNHYTGWNGHTISSVTMHTVQGSYTGCISWFQNPDASAATHYVVASNSSYAGQVTQMVNETNAGWHVGSENWYTIGYEHEGWVDDPSWYTVTMYQTSAALTRDICSDHSINTLRMFYRDTLDDGTALDYGIHSLGAEGSCVKIKGHQHYPNQTHTDPAQYWYWDYYFKLVNPNYTPTTYTAANGNFYDSGGSSANHGDDERLVWLIQPTGGASEITLTFSSFALEDNYDFLYIYDGNDVFSPLIGRYNTTSPGTVTAYSGSMCIEFRSDCLTNEAGWEAAWISVQPDIIEPTTAISVSDSWQTQDFTAYFTDADDVGGSGLEKSFYQVLDYDGAEWHANTGNGFFADNFDSFDAIAWNIPASSGTWSATGGNLIQSDTSVNNTNIYALLNQNLSNCYIYQFYEKIDAATYSTSQHRFGFHFFSDDGSLPNRGNSYFIFFRQETSKLEFYKVESDVFTQVNVVDNVITTFGQWYDFKIIFDRITGKIDVYRDNIFLGTWTDPTPLTNQGNYISFRTGNCKGYISELKVFRSRYPSVTVTVGAASTNDIRYQNPDQVTYGAKIKSIVNDFAGNLSSIAYYDLNIDWTQPACVSVSDGTGTPDEDTTSSLTDLSATWTASIDPNSGIARYWYAIGTTPGAADVTGWTDNALNTSVTQGGLSLNPGQTYYFSVEAKNGAGLTCISSTDGITVNNVTTAGFTMNPNSVCEGESIQFTNTSVNATSYQWTFTGGSPSTSSLANPIVTYNSAGNYYVQLIATGSVTSDTLTQQITVNISPLAAFSTPDTNLVVGSALALFTNSSTGASSYFWDFGDGNTSTDINPWNIYNAAGDYTVTLIAYSTLCGNDTMIMTDYVHVGVTGIDDNTDNAQFMIQPNPFNDNLNISFSLLHEENVRIVILDILGKEIEVVNNVFAAGDHKIVFSETLLAKGVYVMKIFTDNKTTALKLIKY